MICERTLINSTWVECVAYGAPIIALIFQEKIFSFIVTVQCVRCWTMNVLDERKNEFFLMIHDYTGGDTTKPV